MDNVRLDYEERVKEGKQSFQLEVKTRWIQAKSAKNSYRVELKEVSYEQGQSLQL